MTRRKRPFIGRPHSVEDTLRGPVESIVTAARRGQEAAAQHGRQAQRHEARDEDGDHDGDGEFVEQAPQDAAHEQDGYEHRRQREGHREDGKADFARSLEGRLHAAFAHLHVAHDVFEHHDGVVHHEADGEGEGHQREIVQRVAQQEHGGEGPDDGEGQGQAGDEGCREVAQEQEDDEHHQDDREQQRELHIVHRLTDGFRTVVDDVEIHGGGHLLLKRGQQVADTVHHIHGVGAGLALHHQGDGAAIVEPAGHLVVFDAVDDAAELFQADRRAIAVGDDQRAVLFGGLELSAGLHGEGLLGTPQGSGGQVDVVLGEGRLDVLDGDAAGGQQVRIELRAHRVFLRAVDVDLRHAAEHRDPLGNHGLGVIIDHGERKGGRIQREVEDGLIGGVHLAERGRGRHAGGKAALHDGDGLLHVLRGGVEGAVEGELEGDAGAAPGAGGGHRIEAGDGRELALEGGRDGGGHGLGARAGKVGVHRNGRKIDIRQVAHRQPAVTGNAKQDDSAHDQRSHDRPANENLGDVHRSAIS